MKNLEKFGVQEMDAQELIIIEGGDWIVDALALTVGGTLACIDFLHGTWDGLMGVEAH